MIAEAEFMEALQPLVTASGLEIWDVERAGASLRVLVDRPGGVDLEALAALSVAISDFLDDHDDIAPSGRYELDVSSPGLERRLRYPGHFASSVGQEISIKTVSAVNGARRFQGTLEAVTDDHVTLSGQADDGQPFEVQLPLTSIERAHTVFRWGPTPKAPKAGRASKAKRSRDPVTARQGAASHGDLPTPDNAEENQ